MNNSDKYIKTFVETFEISIEQKEDLKYQDIDAWDSVGHMGLIAALEESFGVLLEPDDIVDLSSFEKGKDILSKYDIQM